MKIPLKISLLAILTFAIYTGEILAGTTNNKYFIQFKDKANTPYTLSNPKAYLSDRAIQRRADQKIAIEVNDLPVNPNYVDSIKTTGAQVLYSSKWLNGVVVKIDDTTGTVLSKINGYPFVVKSTDIGRKTSNVSHLPKSFFANEHIVAVNHSSKRTTDQTGYGESFDQIHMLNGELLHYKGFKGQGKVIAVLDAGFYQVNTLPAFDSLWINNQILGTRDFVSFDGDVFNDDTHGMHVLSTMGGNLPGHLIGTAPKASYWLLRSENDFSEYIIEEINWVRAVEFADSVGADVINSSLGYNTFDDPTTDHVYNTDMDGNSTYCARGANIAASKGMLVVVSAGNEGNSGWHYVGTPADADSALTVGAVDVNKNIAGFSSRGPSADGQVKPNVAAMGVATVIGSASGEIMTGNGTSYSSPVMAGMAASLWGSFPEMNNIELLHYIEKSAHLYTNPNDSLGYGIPNFADAYFIATGKSLVGITSLDNSAVVLKNNILNEGVSIYINSDTTQPVTISFYSLTGAKTFEYNTTISKGFNVLETPDSPSFVKGMYILQVMFPEKSVKYTYKTIKY